MKDENILDLISKIANICSFEGQISVDIQTRGAADVAELADAQASGACGLRPVEVRLLSSAFNNRPFTKAVIPKLALNWLCFFTP
jgi:hypothetical protein